MKILFTKIAPQKYGSIKNHIASEWGDKVAASFE